jgi:hypothetical protein
MKENPQPLVAPAKWGLPYAEDQVKPAVQREQSYIVAFAILTIIAWQTEIGTLVLMPFTLLATWFHEMAHGLAAAALGGEFEQLVIYANGSGFAEYSGNFWAIGQAIVSAAGLLGPSIAGCLMIIASRSRRATRLALLGLGVALLVSTAIWVRSIAGWIVLPLFAAAALYIALRGNAKWQRIAVEFLGVQGGVSVYQDLATCSVRAVMSAGIRSCRTLAGSPMPCSFRTGSGVERLRSRSWRWSGNRCRSPAATK